MSGALGRRQSGDARGARAILGRQARGLGAAVGAAWGFRDSLRPHARELALTLVFALGFTLARVAEPWPLQWIFDGALAGRPLDTGWPALDAWLAGSPGRITLAAVGAIVGLALLRGLCDAARMLLTARVGYAVLASVRQRTFAHIQRLPLAWHAQSRVGDLLTRLVSDVQVLRDVLVSSLMTVLTESVVLLGFLIVMFSLDWRLALVAVAVAPLVLAALLVFGNRIREATRAQRRLEGRLATRFQQVLAGIHVVQVFAREEAEDARIAELSAQGLESGLRAASLEARLTRGVELALALGTAATVGLGTWRVLEGHLSPGELIVFTAYMGSFYKPLRRIAGVAERGSKAASSVERITAILETKSELPDGREQAPVFAGNLSFEAVGFAYTPGLPVLEGIDLALPAGRTLALVGPSGAGKSTLLGLVPRLHDPTTGCVRIDGMDLRRFTLASLRAQISVVPQDGMLFGGTIRENLLFGRPDADHAAIVAAAKAAQIHDFISGLPQGYETPVGERGVTLSGGQRQRLAIARAILKDAPIVLLDEPTTGLDSESERAVMTAMRELLAGRTALVIAHRLTTIRHADLIAVVEGGRIVEQGDHASLMAGGGRYPALNALQLDRHATGPRRSGSRGR